MNEIRYFRPLFSKQGVLEAITMPKKVKGQDETREKIALLLRAETPISKITEITGANRATIYRIRSKLKNGINLEHVREPPANKIITEEFLSDLKTSYKISPTTSQSKMARGKECSRRTISRGIQKIGFKAKKRPKRQLLTAKQKEKRVTNGTKLHDKLEELPEGTVKVFSDKKLFNVDVCAYAQTHCVVPADAEPVPITRTKHPQSVMMLGVVGSDGQKMPPYFFKEGLKINGEVYRWVLAHVVKPWLKKAYPKGNYVWQQDSAPGHMADLTQKWCKKHLPDFIPKDLWPPNSPDLNPLDFAVWGYIEPKACATSHPNINSLKEAICREWDDMPKEFIEKSCTSFYRRLKAVIEAGGDHIEGKTRFKS